MSRLLGSEPSPGDLRLEAEARGVGRLPLWDDDEQPVPTEPEAWRGLEVPLQTEGASLSRSHSRPFRDGPQTCTEDRLAYDRAMDDVQLAKRFAAIEHQLRSISEHLGIDCPPFASDGIPTEAEQAADGLQPTTGTEGHPSALPHEVVDLARAGHTTEAISKLRHLTGATLLEAKRAVDALKN
jgi:large subunit ribosomal protein L7/L12